MIFDTQNAVPLSTTASGRTVLSHGGTALCVPQDAETMESQEPFEFCPGYRIWKNGTVESARATRYLGGSKNFGFVGESWHTIKQHISTQHRYASVTVRIDDKPTCVRVHRILATAFIPNPHNKPHINHKNGIRHDNNLENLEWVTPSENARHARDVLKIRPALGSRNGSAKLDEPLVRKIKLLIRSGATQKAIASIFRVHQVTISLIKRGITWKNVEIPQ